MLKFAAFFISTLLLPAAGLKALAGEETGKKTAVVWHWFDESEVEAFRPLLNGVASVDPAAGFRFERLPVGTWSLEENARNALLAAVDEGRPLADLSFAEPGAVAELADRGVLLPLPDSVSLPGPLRFASMYGSRSVMLPLGSYSYALAYDPAVLAEAGMPDGPQTWAELEEAGKKLVRDENGDGVPERYGLGLKLRSGRALEMADLFLYLYQSKGGRVAVENGVLNWDRQAAEWAFGRIYEGGYRWMAPPRVSDRFAAPMQWVSSDRVAAFLKESPGWKIAALPPVEDRARLPMRSYCLIHLNSGRADGEAAANALLTFVSRPQMAGLLSQQTGFLPIHKSAAADPLVKKILKDVAPLPLFPLRQRFDDLLVEAAGDAFGRLRTPAELADFVERSLAPPGPEFNRLPAGAAEAASPYGVCHGGKWEDMRNMGFRWVRKDYSMSGTERPDGSFDWSAYRADALKGRESGVYVLPILDYSSSLSSGAPDDLKSEEERVMFMPRPDRWDAYVRSGVRALRDVVKIWEVWNEPNIEVFQRPVPNATRYAELLKRSYLAIKEEDPTATVMAGGISGISMRWFERLWEAGAADYADVWAVHPYIDLKDLDDGSYVDQLKLLRRQIDRFGERKPIWITEVGFALSQNREAEQTDLEGQAVGVIKTHCQTWASRAVDKIIWYNYDGGEFALREGDNPRPAHTAYQFMIETLGHEPELVDYHRARGGSEFYLFDRNGIPVLIAWNAKGNGFLGLAQPPHTAFKAFDYLGEPVGVDVNSDGYWSVSLDERPVYLVGNPGTEREFLSLFRFFTSVFDKF